LIKKINTGVPKRCIHTRLIFCIIMCIHLFGTLYVLQARGWVSTDCTVATALQSKHPTQYLSLQTIPSQGFCLGWLVPISQTDSTRAAYSLPWWWRQQGPLKRW
jgi:hypothetical protein